MPREQLLYASMEKTLPKMHKTRLRALVETACAATRGAKLTLTDLGRFIHNNANPKHNIKKVDRLLGNKKLQAELLDIYHGISHRILPPTGQLLVIIDICYLKDHHDQQTIRASLVHKGRSLTLYEHVYSKDEMVVATSEFLEHLQVILADRDVVFICDAGFKAGWFKKIESFGWNWLGRVRKNTRKIQFNDNWVAPQDLWKGANGSPNLLGRAFLTKEHTLPCQLVCYKARIKGRVKKNRNGKKCQRRESKTYEAGAHEPWLLATSLNISAEKAVQLYKTRMQIEESFRDLKSHRRGLGARYSGTRSVDRWKVLLLIANLALLLIHMMGSCAREAGYERYYRSNTARGRKEFSDIYLGILILRREGTSLTEELLEKAMSRSWICSQ